MNPTYDFSILKGDKINLQCTVTNPESLLDVTNGSLVITKDGSVLQGEMKNNMFSYNNRSTPQLAKSKSLVARLFFCYLYSFVFVCYP